MAVTGSFFLGPGGAPHVENLLLPSSLTLGRWAGVDGVLSSAASGGPQVLPPSLRQSSESHLLDCSCLGILRVIVQNHKCAPLY